MPDKKIDAAHLLTWLSLMNQGAPTPLSVGEEAVQHSSIERWKQVRRFVDRGA